MTNPSWLVYRADMTGSSWAGIAGAVAGTVTALAALIGVLPALVKMRREQKINGEKIDSVHHIVNQQRTDMQNYQRALERALKDAGLPIPIDQSIEPTH